MPTTETLAPALDLTHIRAQFPSLAQAANGHPAVFLDGLGSTQVTQHFIDVISNTPILGKPSVRRTPDSSPASQRRVS